MSRLVIGVKQIGEMVIGRVLEQNESLRSKKGTGSLTLWTSSNSIFIFYSSCEPQLGKRLLHLRGDNLHEDDREFHCLFDSTAEAVQCVEYIREGVRAINAGTKEKASVATIQLERIE